VGLFRISFGRMAAPETLYKIAPSYDSTIAVEVCKTGLLRKRRHILVFERFEGQLHYSPDDPTGARVQITVDPRSVACRDSWLGLGRQKRVAEFTRSRVLTADRHPEIRFVSKSIAAKPLRGFVVEGTLSLCGADCAVRANLILGPQSNGRFQIDADAPLRLSDFGIKRPSALLGLIGTRDEAMVHMLLWASRSTPEA
jgi:polyisoprenoid-binding protein YceI